MWVLLAMAIGSAGLYVALRTAITLVIVLIISMAMLLFATWLAKWVLAKDEGTADMQDVSAAWGGALTRLVLRSTVGIMMRPVIQDVPLPDLHCSAALSSWTGGKALTLSALAPAAPYCASLPTIKCLLTIRSRCRQSTSAVGIEMAMSAHSTDLGM